MPQGAAYPLTGVLNIFTNSRRPVRAIKLPAQTPSELMI